ncbi:glycerophosphodiester phosphodiesterase [Inquilinus sp. CAU 1745]|uniref:glycerophosphodiester phosphodiesterase n=1 Tax=Inquilinus sp. CAU 1745 TaxID=3140369 RepID=UPI00325B4476
MDIHPFLDHPGPIAFAHRGGVEAAPENTMAAFRAAIGLGYRYLETDAHATADGVLVAFHDDTLDRVTDGSGRIGDLPWSAVAEASAQGHPIPLLEELLTAWPDVRINIDPKTDAAAALLPALLERTGTIDRVCVGSFSDARLGRLRRAMGPGLCTSMGPLAVARLRFESWGLPTGGFDARCAQVSVKGYGVTVVDRRFVETAHARGLQVHVWTIDEEAEMRRLLDLGVDGLMTDRPSLLKRVLVERGQWF